MIRRFLSPPHFEDDDENFRAKFINGFGLILIGLLIVGMIPYLGLDVFNFTLVVLSGLIGVMILSLYLLQKGYLTQSAMILIVLTWFGITIQAYTAEGVRDVIVVGYVAVSLLASLIMNWRIGGIVLLISIAAIWGLSLLEVNGVISLS